MTVQADAYDSIIPESLATLRSKWAHSPRTCFAFEDSQEITAYLLAHAWDSLEPPKLYKPLPTSTGGNILFLHDLAIMKKHAGKGIGKKMVEHLLTQALASDFTKIVLVSVQQSSAFWSKFGFTSQEQSLSNENYGAGAIVMIKTLIK
ncbi:MAG: GNAT family N-acetyltransferase [Gammaproteobacteria bacterium]